MDLRNNMKPYLSIIITAWNEEESFSKGSMEKILEYLAKQNYAWELVIVDDGSDDNTLNILKNYAVSDKRLKIISNLHMGKAQGIMTGVESATGEFVLTIDMDQSTPISEFDNFIKHFDQGSDIVFGSRQDRKGAPLYRQILAYGMIIFRLLVLRLPYRDTQCGFKAYKKEVAKKIFSILQKIHPKRVVVGGVVNPGFDIEILYIGKKLGLNVSEVEVAWQYENSKRVRFIKDALAGVKELLLVRWRSITNAYKINAK